MKRNRIADLVNDIIFEAGKTPARFGYDREMPDILRMVRRDNSPIDVLDVGCGDGKYCMWFANDRYVGIDPGLAKDEIVVSSNRRFVRGTMQNLPFIDASFDLVFSSLVLEHIENVRDALSSLRRVLRPNGVLVLTTATKYARLIGEMQNFFWKIDDEHEGQAHHYFETDVLIGHHLASGFAKADARYIGGPFELCLECFYTFLLYAGMRMRGEMYWHDRDSIIISSGIGNDQFFSYSLTIRRLARAFLAFPKYLGNLFSWWIDKKLSVRKTKVICIVATT